ncbi:copper chaperone CopZ [Metabacillus fastidiosus]|uniref:Copper chaperone CopZ n=1 Tax=Metabacillus fastidiosus TaxID=1458 RepID=A0ABU6P451_9BACI|nr:copper chaperone CopZ [Metabacillus fastidiosus]MED4402926.1 copper chaperone CopZ [Metabacillus fastidiosus]MED4454285.1 copper chaperone CopZ [Metabacillus fastidiosus]MED4461344.1 copper chaperone CopZ [Metabacillus fastidiosus]
MKNITLNVSGMSCGHCVKAIEAAVGKLDGISSVEVHLETGKVDVAYEEVKVNPEAIKEVIDDQGYDVQ